MTPKGTVRLTPLARAALAAMVLMGALDLGCAQHCADQTERKTREAATRAFVHRQPFDKLWTELSQLIRERGYELAKGEKPRPDATLYSAWRDNTRLLMRVAKLRRGRFALRIDQQHRGRDDAGAEKLTTYGRQLDIEWALIERLAPQRAAEVHARARRRGAVAHDMCTGRGCQTCTGFRFGCGCPTESN